MIVPEQANRRLTIVTDAWDPQTNGVVRTLQATARTLAAEGHQVTFVTPQDFRSIPCPSYPEIRLSLPAPGAVGRLIEQSRPDFIHISTEGPLGIAARSYCIRRDMRFTTAYHTKFPDYVKSRCGIPLDWSYRFIRWFHRPSRAVMCATPSLDMELMARGIPHVRRWTRGVDVDLFHPAHRMTESLPPELRDLPRPILLYVGRVAVEKNIEAFLRLDNPGTKVVVGQGPQPATLRVRYPQAVFTGPRFGTELARCYAAADVFVFPSRTDTFGLVILEALASGTPVAAYPVTGPLDIIGASDVPVGAVDLDLGQAVERALKVPRGDCRAYALRNSWAAASGQFLGNLVPA